MGTLGAIGVSMGVGLSVAVVRDVLMRKARIRDGR